LQTVIDVAYKFLLPKFIGECNRLLPDWAADSTRCMELCAYYSSLFTIIDNTEPEIEEET